MGLVLYTAGVVVIVLGIVKFIGIVINSHLILDGIIMLLVCIAIGITAIADGLIYMKQKNTKGGK